MSKSVTWTGRATLIVAAAGLAWWGATGTAQTPPAAEAAPAAAVPVTKPAGAFPDLATLIKDMEELPGLMTLYRHKPGDATKDQTRLLCRVPRELLGKDLLMANSMSRGASFGFPLDRGVLVRWELIGQRVVLSVPDARFVTTPGKPVTEAVQRTYQPSFLFAMPVLTITRDGDPVFDLGEALTSRSVSGLPAPMRELSRFEKVKVFPDNILIDADLAVGGRTGGSRLGVSYAFRRLPEKNGFEPRVADERVGFFTTVRQDWGARYSERENIVRYVNRWRLEKKDSSLELSPPVQPIVFVIEKSVPLQWRRYVAEGILEWNKAYEKIGFSNAIVVQQQTDDNEFAAVDPEDARYNFIRWVVTGSAFAMGPSRADPRTGQILDADIIFDDSMLRFQFREFEVFGPKALVSRMSPPEIDRVRRDPTLLPPGVTLADIEEALRDEPQELIRGLGEDEAGLGVPVEATIDGAQCGYGEGMARHLGVLRSAAAAAGMPDVPERLIGQLVREVVMHEVGHTLGLRHNFKASSWLSLEQMRGRRDSGEEATVASVMDYNGAIFFADDEIEKLRNIVTPTLGPYDYWAIEYGYRVPGKEDGDVKAMLGKIASRAAARELAYGTDEDTQGGFSPDPLTNRWDAGDDPAAWAASRVDLVKALLARLDEWAAKPEHPNHFLTSTVRALLWEKSVGYSFVSRTVGGQYFSRARPGDAEAAAPLVPVDPKAQRAALKTLGETLFNDQFIQLDAALLNRLVASRWGDWASRSPSRIDFPVHDFIAQQQWSALSTLTSPAVLQRVYDAELKSSGEDRFTAAELIRGVRDMIWGDLKLSGDAPYTDARPMLTSIRRNLQKQHLEMMLRLARDEAGAGSISPDLRSMVRYSLRETGVRIGELLKSAGDGPDARLDFATRAHLVESRSRIERVLDAPAIEQGNPLSWIIFLQEAGLLPPSTPGQRR